jgi:Glu-tRNA(Gln) amidotransferase subunit E-like FAD-binding protein
MKRLVTVVSLVVLMVFGTSLALAADIKDVKQDHWAYESVKYLVDKGYVQLYDDSTFRGAETVDRYGLASVLAKILKELSSESVDIAKGDLELLRKLTVEFREELVALSLRSSEVESAFGELEKSICGTCCTSESEQSIDILMPTYQ